MQSLKIAMVTAAMTSVLSVTAQAAECKKVTALGEMVTYDSAHLFSTNALKNILASQGLVGKGPVQTTCKASGATTTCHSTQMACKGGEPKTCLGAWLCL